MSDKLTIDHYVAECFIKCANVILSSRIYKEAPIAPSRGASRWVRAAPCRASGGRCGLTAGLPCKPPTTIRPAPRARSSC
jgi:hypothetical protein